MRLMLPLICLLTACSPVNPPPTHPPGNDAKDIFKAKCATCHSTSQPVLSPLTDILNDSALLAGGYIVPGDLAKSKIWVRVSQSQMPPSGSDQLTDKEKQTISDYIVNYPKDNK
jgi:mono/diheme cytochrome c family protein